MNDRQSNPWIHIGECPVCVDGLCRVRTCTTPNGESHFYALCDECEATWIEPDNSSQKTFPDAEHPQCPICAADLFGPQAHWSQADELRGSKWSEFAIAIEVPPDSERHTLEPGKEYLASTSAAQLAESSTESDTSPSQDVACDKDQARAQDEVNLGDEPKPGC